MSATPSSTIDCSSSITEASVLESRLPVGSSQISTDGEAISARAMATRCRSPPESRDASALSRSARPTRSASSAARARLRRTDLAPCDSRPMATLSITEYSSMSTKSWNTNPNT